MSFRSPLAAALVLTLAAGGAPARAQLPPLPPAPGLPQPEQPPQRPPSPPPPPPNPGPGPATGDVVSYRGNPQHTQSAADESVFGPLQPLWSKDFKAPPSQPLIIGDRVIANVPKPGLDGSGSLVVALDRATGKELWRQTVPGAPSTAHIAYDSGLVFAATNSGSVYAFAITDGRQRWDSPLPMSSFTVPVAAGGTVYVHVDGGLHALAADTGSLRWQTFVKVGASYAAPALDGQHVYVADQCGQAAAMRRTDGAVVWVRGRGMDCTGMAPLLINGILMGQGASYDAATGAERAPLPEGAPEAADGDTGYLRLQAKVAAFALEGGAKRWSYGGEGSYESSLPPLVSGGTVYAANGGLVAALDRMTGERRYWSSLAYGSPGSPFGRRPGMSAGHSVLVATAGTRLNAFEPVLRPESSASDLGADDYFPYAGRKISIVAGVGADLRRDGPDDIVVEHDVYPYGRYARVRAGRTAADGTIYFDGVRPARNTRYRARLESGGGASRTMEIYAYPRSSYAFRAAGNRRVELAVRMTATKSFRVGGRTLVVYFNRRGSKRLSRVGSGRLAHIGSGVARARVRFRPPHGVRQKDFFYWCVRGLRGYGYPDALTRRCGAATITDS